MASDLGWSLMIMSNNLDNGLTRQIFFAKYINWVVSFPAIILVLGLLSGVSWATIVYQVFLSWFWILAYIAGAYTPTNYKWGFFAFGTFAWVLLTLSQWMHGRKAAKRVGVTRDYTILLGWLTLLWLLYPVAWGLSDGGNKIGETAGFIFFGILDVLLLPILSFVTMAMSSNWDYGKLNIAFTQYGRVPVASGPFPEKAAAAPGAAPAPAPAAAPTAGPTAAPTATSAPAATTPASVPAMQQNVVETV